MLQDVDFAHTVFVFVALQSVIVLIGCLHLTALLGGRVLVVKSQQAQSLLYVDVCFGFVTVHFHGKVVVMVFVQATIPCRLAIGGSSAAGLRPGIVPPSDGLQLVTVVVPAEVGAGVGHTCACQRLRALKGKNQYQ